jgi:hypothetical protein
MTRLTLKAILPYLGYLIAAGTALYTWGRKDESNKNNITGIEKNVNLLLKSDTLKTMQFAEFTKLLNEHLIATQKQEIDFKILIRNYSKFVQANTQGVQEWKEFMQGLTFEVMQEEPMKSVSPGPRIRIKQIPRDSVK